MKVKIEKLSEEMRDKVKQGKKLEKTKLKNVEESLTKNQTNNKK